MKLAFFPPGKLVALFWLFSAIVILGIASIWTMMVVDLLIGLGILVVPFVIIVALIMATKLTLERLLWVFIIGLPLHTFVMMILFGVAGLPVWTITVLATWKELIAIGAACIFILRALPALLRGPIRITLSDQLVLLLIIWVFGRLTWSYFDGNVVPLTAQIYGLRFYIIPLALYAVGRLGILSDSVRNRLLWMLSLLGGITGAIAVVEYLLPNNLWIEMIRAIGYHDYFINYVNHTAMWGPGDTSASMWVYVGGFIRRAGSIYFVSKPYAFTYILIIPVIFALLWTECRPKLRRILWICASFSGLGLVMTVTRAAIVVGSLVFLGMAFLLKRWNIWFLALLSGSIIGLALFSMPPVQNYITTILRGSESSTRQHLDGWILSLLNPDMPWVVGYGIGTANQENARLDLDPERYRLGVASESIYVQVLQELGLIGLCIYIALQIAIIIRANALIAVGELLRFRIGLVVRWTTIGLLLVSFVAIPWQSSLVTTYFFWIMTGQVGAMQLTAPGHESLLQ